jgi:hypothetical protein
MKGDNEGYRLLISGAGPVNIGGVINKGGGAFENFLSVFVIPVVLFVVVVVVVVMVVEIIGLSFVSTEGSGTKNKKRKQNNDKNSLKTNREA